jgi:hypothetical protein
MTLYRDIPIMLLPMTSLVHAFSQMLFGRTEAAIRILDLLWTMATAGVLSLFVSKVFGRPWLGVIAGLIYTFTYYSSDSWNTAQVDGFLNLPLVISMYLLARGLASDSPSPRSSFRSAKASDGIWFVAGLLMGISLLFKYTIGLLVPAVVLVMVFAKGWRRAQNWLAPVWFCGGCLVTGLVALSIFVLSGALTAFIRLQIGTTMPYARLYHPASLRQALSYSNINSLPAYLLGIPGLLPALAMLRAKHRESASSAALGAALTLVWIAAAFGSVLLQGKFFHYHYLPSLLPLAVLGALTLATVFRPLAGHLASPGRRVVLVTFALAGLAFSTRYPERLVDLARVATNRLSLHELWMRKEFSFAKFSVPENMELTDYLLGNTGPYDRTSNLDRDLPFTFPAWREPVLRIATTASADPASWKLNDEFRANPPNVLTVKHGERFVDSDWTGSQAVDERLMTFAFRHGEVVHWVVAGKRDGYELLMAFTELRDFVAARYELEARVGHYDVLRLANSDSVMPVSADSVGRLNDDLGEALGWLKTHIMSGRRRAVDSIHTVFWPMHLPGGLDSILSARMMSHKSANGALWTGEKKLDDLLPALSVWVAKDERPFARQDPFRQQVDGKDYDAGGLSFRLQHRCHNGLVFVYDVRSAPAP